MDADVDIQKFADHAIVIERPAGASELADLATRFLVEKGLRINLGVSKAVADKSHELIRGSLPTDVAMLDRKSMTASSYNGYEIIVAPAPRPSLDPNKTRSVVQSAMEVFSMVGHARHGASLSLSANVASELGAKSGITGSAVNDFLIKTGYRGSFGGSLLDQIRSEAKLDADGLKTASIPKPNNLGQLQVLDIKGFAVKEFASAPHGPSYLDPAKFNTNSLEEVQGLHADLLRVVSRARELSAVKFEVVPETGGMRSEKEQNRLKKAGKSRAKLGRHTIGHAVDLVPVDASGNVDFSDLKGFDEIRRVMELAANELGIPIQWGGNWKKLVDKPHFELDRRFYPGPQEEADPRPVETAFR